MSEDFIRAAVGFFAIIDPVSNILIFEAITRGEPQRQRVVNAFLSIGLALGLLVLFTFAGEGVLDFLDISMASFQIAAGVLLIVPALRLVETGTIFDASNVPSGIEAAIVPLAIPLLAGPGALALAISYGAEFGAGVTLSAAGTVLALTLAAFLGASMLLRLFPEPVFQALARLVGVLLMAIAVDFIVTGWHAA